MIPGEVLLVYVIALAFWALVITLIVMLVRSARVSRSALERFARSQFLVVTADNGNLVLRYLATTRRWRLGGLLVGLVLATLVSIGESQSTAMDASGGFSYIPLFAGWFLGAVLAEVRGAYLSHGPVRTASLRRRRARDYLGGVTWALVPALGVIAVAIGAIELALDLAGQVRTNWTAWSWLAVSIAVAVAIRLTQRRVLHRPQPMAAPDVLAADDAVRSRSLHVLAGGGFTLLIVCLFAQSGGVYVDGYPITSTFSALWLLLSFVPLLGLPIATAAWVPPPGPAEPGPIGPVGEPVAGPA